MRIKYYVNVEIKKYGLLNVNYRNVDLGFSIFIGGNARGIAFCCILGENVLYILTPRKFFFGTLHF